MVTKEQHLVNIKAEKNLELETHFKNLIMGGTTFEYGTSATIVNVAGGKEAMDGLSGLLQYYSDNDINECKIRDAINKKVYSGTLTELATFVTEVRDWGMSSYLNNITKQDYVNACTTVEDVLDVTWDSVE